MPNQSTNLDWQSVLLVKVTHEPFTGTSCSLHVSRAHLALHPDGVIMSAWELPLAERVYPRIRLVGWKPLRDVPFDLPVRFQRGGRGLSQIANGTWILPYNQTTYDIYRHTYNEWLRLMTLIADHPNHPYTLEKLMQLLTTKGT